MVFYPNEGDYPGMGGRSIGWVAFWILAPFVVLMVAIGIGQALIPAEDERLSGRLIGAAIRGDGEEVPLREASGFAWDRVCIFPPFTPVARVREVLGVGWSGVLNHDWPTLVFVDARSVVRYAGVPRRAVGDPPTGGMCQSADEAVLRWRPAP